MLLHNIDSPEDVRRVSERMWEISQLYTPELKAVMDKVIADERLDREDLIHMGFTFGAAFCLGELGKGNIRPIGGE